MELVGIKRTYKDGRVELEPIARRQVLPEIVEEHDDKGRLIHKIFKFNHHSHEDWMTYDDHDRIVYKKSLFKDGSIKEIFNKYNDKGQEIYTKMVWDGEITVHTYEYDANDYLSHHYINGKLVEHTRYNDNGLKMYSINYDGTDSSIFERLEDGGWKDTKITNGGTCTTIETMNSDGETIHHLDLGPAYEREIHYNYDGSSLTGWVMQETRTHEDDSGNVVEVKEIREFDGDAHPLVVITGDFVEEYIYDL